MLDSGPPPTNQKHLLPSDLPFPVVGIGASAGGVEALKVFFGNMPPAPGMAFVVVLHLSPQHESVLHHVLQPLTAMPVTQVTHSMLVERDHVYVIPPAASLSMNDGYLRVSPHERGGSPPVAIDLFFRTLADVHKSRSIGIVMTGGGSDGSVGLARIKEQGGVTLAQSPEDAKHDAMPRSAITTGGVDIVLPVAQMPARLKEIAENMARIRLPRPVGSPLDPDGEPPEETSVDRNALRDILTLLRTRTGHDFRHYKRATVLRRIERRMQVRGVPDMPAYAALLQQNVEETPRLLGDMLIGVTQFFRDKEAFESLERHAIAPLVKGRDGKAPASVRAWVAGCATGEEAYSVAMLLASHADALPSPPRIQVFATDIDEPSLASGRAGSYPAAISTDVPPAMLHSYFSKDKAGYQIKKDIRERVLFAPHNVLRDPPFSRLDLVTCRNLLIYLDRDVQLDVLRMFHFALKPGGYLLLGSSESADACESLFTVVDKHNRLYQAKSAAYVHRSIPMLPATGFDKAARTVPADAAPGRCIKMSFADIHQRALEQYAPPSVIVDREGNIVHMSDRAGRFLRLTGGEPSRSLPALVHSELRMELRTAMFQALHSRKSVEARRVGLHMDGRHAYINMVVRPFRHDETNSDFMLVIFDEVDAVMSPGEPGVDGTAASSMLAQLEAELQQAKERLQLTMEQSETSTEELKASNEALQAINEELRLATEELETGKEELQSVNEELITVNSELKAKVEETAKINDDLQNLIASTDIATVFVDRGMRIKWFTPRAADIFSVIGSDAGRSLLDIAHRLHYPDLARDAAGVFESLRTVEREVRSRDGRWYLARLLPYRSAEHRIEGAVLTFIDITDRRKAEERVRLGEAHMRLVAQSTKNVAIITLDDAGRITTWNAGAQRIFGYEEAEAVGRPIDIIFTAEDVDAGVPRTELELARRTGHAAEDRWHRRKDGGRIYCTGSLNVMKDADFEGYAKIVRDITEQRRREDEQASQLEMTQADNTLKDEFFAVMSHELKHPLNLIQLNADLLVRTPAVRSSPGAIRAAETIQHSVRSQARIIEDLLDMARIRTGKLKLNRGVVSLTDTVESILAVLRHTAAAAGVELRHDYDVSDALHIDADSVRIEQIIWNLLNNGIKFTPTGGSVTVRLAREGDTARLDVADTGEGIDPAFLAKIFEMYSQVEMRHRGINREGLGIGLAVVAHLVEAHGGRIEAASEGKGKGACFTVWLPAANQGRADAKTPAPAEAGQLTGLRILVVDDSEDILETFQALLEMEGAQVTIAVSGERALQALEASKAYDLILSDVGMPVMDGYALMQEIRRRHPDLRIPAIALTGYGSKEHVDKAMQAGFATHLNKPIPLDALVETVTRTLGRS